MIDPEKIRDQVSDTYTSAARAEPENTGGCCGGSQEVQPKGVASKLGGYDRTDLDSLPADAVVNSFGCGNPVAFAEVREGDVVLDLGSGAGIDVLLAARKVGESGRVIGVDMTDEMVERARANVAAAGHDNVEIHKGIIEKLPVADASVDWVISNCVINLSPEKERVFAEIARVLKPGGRMIVSDIVVQDLPDWARNHKDLYGGCLGGAIDEVEYLSGLRRAGIGDARITDRIIYDEAQLRAFIDSEARDTSSCCDRSADPGLAKQQVDELVTQMQGKVFSAKLEGRRDGASPSQAG